MKKPCTFCYEGPFGRQLENEIIHHYQYFDLALNIESARVFRSAAGFLISTVHVPHLRDLPNEAKLEIYDIEEDAAIRLCQAVGKTFLGSYNPNENVGKLAGQTIMHAHRHISPVTENDFKGGFIAALKAYSQETNRR